VFHENYHEQSTRDPRIDEQTRSVLSTIHTQLKHVQDSVPLVSLTYGKREISIPLPLASCDLMSFIEPLVKDLCHDPLVKLRHHGYLAKVVNGQNQYYVRGDYSRTLQFVLKPNDELIFKFQREGEVPHARCDCYWTGDSTKDGPKYALLNVPIKDDDYL